VVALLALESLAPLDKGLILGLLGGPLLHLCAAPLRLVYGVRESLIRPQHLCDLDNGGRVLRRIQSVEDLLQQPDVLVHIGRDTLALLVDYCPHRVCVHPCCHLESSTLGWLAEQGRGGLGETLEAEGLRWTICL
jgi:hypothetical protein